MEDILTEVWFEVKMQNRERNNGRQLKKETNKERKIGKNTRNKEARKYK